MNGEFFTEKNEPDTTSSVIDHQQREASRCLIVEGPEKKLESTTASPKLDSSCSSPVVGEKTISTAPSSTIITNEEHQQQQQLVSCLKEEEDLKREETKAKFSAEENCHSDICDRDKMDQNANKVLQQDQQRFEKRVQGTITTPDEGIDIDNFVSQPISVDSSSTNGNFNGFASSTGHHHHNPVSYEDIDFLSKSPKNVNNAPNLLESEIFEDQQKEKRQQEEELFAEEPPIRLNSNSSIDIIKDDESEDLESRQNFKLENSCNIINGVFENSIIIDRNSLSFSSDLPPPPPATMDDLTFKSEKTESPIEGRANLLTESPVTVADFPNTVIDGIFDNRPILSTYGQDTGEPAEDLLSPSDDENAGRLLDLMGGEEVYTCRIMTPETDRGSESDVLSKPESPLPVLEPQSPDPIFKPESPIHAPELASPIPAPKSESPAPISTSENPVHVPKPESPFPKSESPIPKLESPILKSESPIPKLESPDPISESLMPKLESPVSKSQSPILKSGSPIPKLESPVPKSESPILKSGSPMPKLESPRPESESSNPILQKQNALPAPKVESPVPSAPLLSDEVIHQEDTKVYGDDIDHVSRAYDESQKALFHQRDFIQDADMSLIAAMHDNFSIDAIHDHNGESIVEHHHESVRIGISSPSDLFVESPMISPAPLDHRAEDTISPITSRIELGIVDGIEKSEHRFTSPQLVEEPEIKQSVDEKLTPIPDMYIDHIPRDEPKLAYELISHPHEAKASEPKSSPEVAVPEMKEEFLAHEFKAPVTTSKHLEEKEVKTKTMEPLEKTSFKPQVSAKLQPTVDHVETMESKIPEPIVELSKENSELDKVEKIEPSIEEIVPEPVIKPAEEKAKVEAAKPAVKSPEVTANMAKLAHSPKQPTKVEEKKKPTPSLDAKLDQTKKTVSPAAPKASPVGPKPTAATSKPAVATKAAAPKPAKATPEPKPATPKVAPPAKPTTPKTPVAPLGRRTQSHSPARPAPPPPAAGAQSRRDSKPKASEIFAERKKKREEEHSNKKKGVAAAAPTATANEDKIQQEKEQRRKEAEAAFQSWLQRKDQERKRARSTGRPVDSLHTKDAKNAANKRRDDAQAAFQLKQKPDAKEDHV